MVEHGEKNSKCFAGLEKKRSAAKLISTLKVNNKTSKSNRNTFGNWFVFIRTSIINGKWDSHLIISLTNQFVN